MDEKEKLLSNDDQQKQKSHGGRNRIRSLDFFRGFVIVNLFTKYYTCEFDVMGDWCGPDLSLFIGWEQLIMPMFYLCVGFAMQLTLKSKLQSEGFVEMAKKQIGRSMTLFTIGLIIEGTAGFDCYYKENCRDENALQAHPSWWFWKWFGFKNIDLYQTLEIIAVTQIILLPAIGRSFRHRFAYMLLLYVCYSIGQSSFWICQVWNIVDGGSFGCFGQATTMLFGSFLDDFFIYATSAENPDITYSFAKKYGGDVELPSSSPSSSSTSSSSSSSSSPSTEVLDYSRKRRMLKSIGILCVVAGAMMGIGVWMTTLPQRYCACCWHAYTRASMDCQDGGVISKPFIRPPTDSLSCWNLSERSLSPPFIIFSIGWGYWMYAMCFVVSEVMQRNFKLLDDFSHRCLLMYLLITFTNSNVLPQLFPRDGPWWLVPLSFLFGTFLTLKGLKFFKEQNLNIKL